MESVSSRFLVGIDLGTSNSAVFYLDREDLEQEFHHFPISQWIERGQIHSRPTLPSYLYLLTDEEMKSNQFQLPWEAGSPAYIAGVWARLQQSQNPGRVINSVKSWLCYHQIDPHSKILPQSDIEGLPHYSPIDVTSFYISHIVAAWNAYFAQDEPKDCLENQQVVLTVPASFDEAAREYTAHAIQQAGLQHFTLLEEPQAAFYSWISSNEYKLEEKEGDEHIAVVIDIGGGTTDFSLVRMGNLAVDGSSQLSFERIAVGEHILLGGDNIDLTMATRMEHLLTGGNRQLPPRVWESVVAQCRRAKEVLLCGENDNYQITIAKAGSRMVGETQTLTVTLDMIKKIILDGFFPLVPWNTPSVQSRQHGLKQLGLPYAQDPAITRHLCTFLKRYIAEHPESVVFPDQILFNGGTLSSVLLQARLQQQLEQWRLELLEQQVKVTNSPIQIMKTVDMQLAVARGAVAFHLARLGLGIRITGGSARSYYISLMIHDPDQDCFEEGWLCVLPQQATMETALPVSDVEFLLSINQPVQLRLLSSIHRPYDVPGQTFHFAEDEMENDFVLLPPVQTLIRVDKKMVTKKAREISVKLRVQLNEIGTLSLFCVDSQRQQEWKMEFLIRQTHPAATSSAEHTNSLVDNVLPAGWENGERCIRQRYGKRSRTQPKEDLRPFSLYKQLEQELEIPREEWSIFVLRKLWDLLYEGASYRVRSSYHESNWIKLAGFCLRPGFGYAKDEWRVRQLEELLREGPYFKKERAIEIEWWIMCRRIAGGLPAQVQQSLSEFAWDRLQESVRSTKPPLSKKRAGKKKNTKPKLDFASLNELWRMAASLENIPAEAKIKFGEKLMSHIKSKKFSGSDGWCLARFGMRAPLYGSPVHAIPQGVVEPWIKWLLTANHLPFQAEIPLILMRLGQSTGDRKRDIDSALQQDILEYMKKHEGTEYLQKMLLEPAAPVETTMQNQEMNDWLFGDALPVGLKIAKPLS
ncbi:MAG: Hsp70 family protein [SAR324 cluster bacterium]|nr:Hsp70 family protein [SAR324 cluster bacterium]